MNIFFTHQDPIQAADFLKPDKVRSNKVIIEIWQAVAYLCEKHSLPLPLKKDGSPFKTKLASRFPKPLLEWLEKPYSLIWIDKYIHELNPFHCLNNDHNNIILLELHCYILGYNFKKERYKEDEPLTPFPNYAKSKAKNLDYTHLPVHEAYQEYLKVQWERGDIK